MASIQLPPWLNLDPLAPARIRLQANAQRNAAAANEQASQQRAQELQFRREQAASQAAQEESRLAAQERAAERRDQVLRQTQDQELAQAAQQMQLRRESQAAKSEQFQQTLRLKQQVAEQEAKSAAQQMQGMKAVQEGLEKGTPLEKLIAANAPLLFPGRADRAIGALQRVPKAVAGPPDYVAHELMTPEGKGTGIQVRAGAHGAVVPLPRREMTPEGLLKAYQVRLGVISKQLEEADPSSPQFSKLIQDRDAIMKSLEDMTSRRGAAALSTGAPPQTPSAAPAPSSDTVRVTSPDGKSGMIPRTQLAAALKAGYKEIAPEPAAAHEEEGAEEEAAPEEEEE